MIPADGYYEWTKAEDGGKDPWFIFLPGPTPFAFAGLWAYNTALDLYSCTIVTGPAVLPTSQLHDRIPYILDPEFYDAWLSKGTALADLKPMLNEHNLNGQLQFHRVSRDVNSSKFAGDPGCVNPA